MPSFHSTFIKKIFSSLFETNALAPINPEVNTSVQPCVILEPNVKIFTIQDSGLLLQTASDKDFYVTSMSISVASDDNVGSSDLSTITFVDDDNNTKIIGCGAWDNSLNDGAGNSIEVNFAKRGLKLARSSPVLATLTHDKGSFHIVGYYGSDRE